MVVLDQEWLLEVGAARRSCRLCEVICCVRRPDDEVLGEDLVVLQLIRAGLEDASLWLGSQGTPARLRGQLGRAFPGVRELGVSLLPRLGAVRQTGRVAISDYCLEPLLGGRGRSCVAQPLDSLRRDFWVLEVHREGLLVLAHDCLVCSGADSRARLGQLRHFELPARDQVRERSA